MGEYPQPPLAQALLHLPQEPKPCGRLVEAKWQGARAPTGVKGWCKGSAKTRLRKSRPSGRCPPTFH